MPEDEPPVLVSLWGAYRQLRSWAYSTTEKGLEVEGGDEIDGTAP